MRPSGVPVVMPAWLYPLFKRVFWRHINGATFSKPPGGGWAHVRVTRERLA